MVQPKFEGKNVVISCNFSILIFKRYAVFSDLSAFPHGNLWQSQVLSLLEVSISAD